MKERKGGSIFKWDHNNKTGEPLDWIPDQEHPVIVRGFFKGLRTIPSNFGDGFVLDLDTGAENQTWSVPQILHSKLDGLTAGDAVEIHYIGKRETNSGNIAHQFQVFELDADEAAELIPSR